MKRNSYQYNFKHEYNLEYEAGKEAKHDMLIAFALSALFFVGYIFIRLHH